MGAVLAIAYAARYPHLVRRLILLSLPYFGSQADAYKWFRRTRGGWIYTNMMATALACMFTRRVIGKLLPYLLRDIPRSVAEVGETRFSGGASCCYFTNLSEDCMKRIPRRNFTAEFKRETVQLITQHGLTLTEASRKIDIAPIPVRTWME